jgi:hypothetical protein
MIDDPHRQDVKESIYLAGPLGSSDWRLFIVQGLHDRSWNWPKGEPFPVLKGSIFGKFNYVGPYWPWYRRKPLLPRKGADADSQLCDIGVYGRRGRQLKSEHFYEQCRAAIRRADVVFAVLPRDSGIRNLADSHQSMRTISELLYACAHGKRVVSLGYSPLSYDFRPEIVSAVCDVASPRQALGKLLELSTQEVNAAAGHGFVYFVEQLANRHIKIGWARNPKERLKSFRTGSSTGIRLLGMIPGSRHLERKLHTDFQAFHVKGEWFFGVKRIRRVIKEEAFLPSAQECDGTPT